MQFFDETAFFVERLGTHGQLPRRKKPSVGLVKEIG